ncbi:hypothetical protein NPIL_353711 [Nephila pilipes]|uniref:Uncharacterized protein n=1 Tax=Nephila pilipes TaxID=299642 RepID=A0A8X6QNK3_NEPPI|nr:hypothetical protein NPIL_353711 [Nephila pilipes]
MCSENNKGLLTLGEALKYLKDLDNVELSEISPAEDDEGTDKIDLTTIPPDADIIIDEEYIDDAVLNDNAVVKDVSGVLQFFNKSCNKGKGEK